MNISLEPIKLNEDKTNPIYASEDCQETLKMWEEYYPKIGFTPPWNGYFVKRANQFVGCCAFTGKPVENRVEISYWTFKEFEGQGIASLACKELLLIAKRTDSTIQVMAKTAPENNASTKILERNGFVFSKVVQDHEIGDAWEWLLL